MWGRARGFSSYCHCIKRIRHDRGLKIAARPRKRSGTNRLRHRRRCSGADDSKQSFPIDRLEGRAVRFGPRICADQDAGCCSCLVLDIRLPGVSGLDFQAELAEADIRIPIIFMTGHGDIPMSVKAMKAGAIDFLTKPFRDQDILDAVIRALERDQKRRDSEKAVSELRILSDSLTSREREVMTLVVAGLMNKQIAAKLGITEITVKVHRGHMMRKMKTRSLIDLAATADLLGIRRPKH